MSPFYTPFPWPLLIVTGLVFVVFVSLALVLLCDGIKNRVRARLAGVAFGIVTVCLLALSIGTMVAAQANKETMTATRIADIAETYGLAVGEKDYWSLKYPSTKPEEGGFETYGTALLTAREDSGSIVQRQVTLVWNEDEFQLLQGEGAVSSLEEVPRRGALNP